MRKLIVALGVALVLVSCGSDEMSLTEYAEEVEGLTTTMYARLDELTLVTPPGEWPTVSQVQTTYSGVAAATHELLDGLQAIEPPDDVAEAHATSIDIMSRLVSAHDALTQRAQQVETQDELPALLASPESVAAGALQDEITAFCQATQAQFDATAERDVFADVPWIPSEVREVVLVAFGCGSPNEGG